MPAESHQRVADKLHGDLPQKTTEPGCSHDLRTVDKPDQTRYQTSLAQITVTVGDNQVDAFRLSGKGQRLGLFHMRQRDDVIRTLTL